MSALVALYAGALFFLAFSSLRSDFPIPLFLLMSWWLCHEAEARYIDYSRYRGRLCLYRDGTVGWAGYRWLVCQTKICTSVVIVLKLRGREGQRGWLVVSPSSCREPDYRSLALFSRYLVAS
ncbi:protein YgfX [Photobacterium aquae]|uniref:protein YgfX n=1 Tax=Photobacterium aquae TaxID=1195763 RepID=UPI0012EDC08C|nr:protein YgfX [Photobacterium aquae]